MRNMNRPRQAASAAKKSFKAKKEETRARRVEKTIEALLKSKKGV